MELSLPTKDEFVSRWNAAKEQLETSNLDLLFVYSNDRAMHGPGNVRYFSDFPAHFEDTAVLIAKEGEPVLLTGPECKEYAQTVSFIDDIRVIEEFAMPDEEYPFTEMQIWSMNYADGQGGIVKGSALSAWTLSRK